ncbi:MAG: hypothetical protein BAJALOKI2v1_750006 [Promethearchaeota archaeon]|nr:MAG: hypothetical protein BAJALOKI2v1_750006 [Candidatus Lokiarchaeota archaeon]
MTLYEIGFVFRGFILVNYIFKELPDQVNVEDPGKDLRGAFISAINTFVENAFINNSIEYLELENYLFIFKMDEMKSSDSTQKETLILYGITDKKRKIDKFVRKFLEEVHPILQLFKKRYYNKDLTELDQFKSFKEEIKAFYE